MKKRIGMAVAGAAALAAVAAPAQAGIRYVMHPTTAVQYDSVYRWDEGSSVDITLGHEGHRTNHWTNAQGTFKTKTYPTVIDGDTARAVFMLYPHTKNTWVLWAKKWCSPAPAAATTKATGDICTPEPPA